MAPEKTIKAILAAVEATAMRTDAIPPLAPTLEESTARVGASLHIKGEISGNEDLQVDGSIEGSIQLGGRKLTVGPSGKVIADVVAREVVVYGSSKGNLRAGERIEIKKEGSAVGDLTTANIIIEDGAHFQGSIEIDRKAVDTGPDLDKPAYARVAASTAYTTAAESS